jgi:cobalt-zinc-cadmium efflux system membrane fusion protein
MKDKLISFAAKHQVLLIVAILFLVSGLIIGRLTHSNGGFSVFAESEHADHNEASELDEHDDHGHAAAETECGEYCLDELEATACEHDIPITDCDECRYEVGVVKVDASLAASLLETGLVEEVDRQQVLTFTGQVQLDRTRSVDVVPAGGGQVKQVLTQLGETVEKGDILAVIHSADLGQAKAAYLEAQSTLELTAATYNREKGLYDKQVSSQSDYLSALNAMKAAEAAYAAAEKRLHLFGLTAEHIAAIKDEKQNGEFGELVLRAPQAGTVIVQDISAGMIVDTTASLYTIADLSNLWVWCDVYAKDLAVLHEHFSKASSLPATVHVNGFASTPFEGVVDLVGNVMDEHTRTVKMRVQVKNPGRQLRPGLFADIEVRIPLEGRMAVVPYTAVMSDAGTHFVFQHWKDDLWARTDVVAGARYGEYTEIIAGLSTGTPIVTSGAFMLKSDILREQMGAGCAH